MVQVRLPDHGPLLHLLFLFSIIFSNFVSGTELRGDKLEAPFDETARHQVAGDGLRERAAPSASLPSPPVAVNNPGMAPAAVPSQPSNGAESQKHQQDKCPSASQQPTTTSQDDRYIKIAGILVPAIVAIGLGIAGMVVTLHVNSSPRSEDEGNYRSN